MCNTVGMAAIAACSGKQNARRTVMAVQLLLELLQRAPQTVQRVSSVCRWWHSLNAAHRSPLPATPLVPRSCTRLPPSAA